MDLYFQANCTVQHVIISESLTRSSFDCSTGSQLQDERVYNHDFIPIPFVVIMSCEPVE